MAAYGQSCVVVAIDGARVCLHDVVFLIDTSRQWELDEHSEAAARLLDGERPFDWMDSEHTQHHSQELSYDPDTGLIRREDGSTADIFGLEDALVSLYMFGTSRLPVAA